MFGLFSGALLLSAVLGPSVGRAIDNRGGRAVLALSNPVLAAGLVLLGVAQGKNLEFHGANVLVPASRPQHDSHDRDASVGDGEMYPATLRGDRDLTAILTSLTFVRFSRPRAKFCVGQAQRWIGIGAP